MLVVNIIIGLYGTPADRQAVLRLAWYIRLIRFEDSIRTQKNDSQVPSVCGQETPKPMATKFRMSVGVHAVITRANFDEVVKIG